MAKIKLSDEEVVRIHMDHYQTGKSIEECGDIAGVSLGHMSTRFRDLGLPTSRKVEERYWRPDDRDDDATPRPSANGHGPASHPVNEPTPVRVQTVAATAVAQRPVVYLVDDGDDAPAEAAEDAPQAAAAARANGVVGGRADDGSTGGARPASDLLALQDLLRLAAESGARGILNVQIECEFEIELGGGQ